MEKAINVYKPLGKTPYYVIKLLKQKDQYRGVALGYAGRLDPMAEGVLVVLIGEENKKRKDYEKLDKEYLFTMLLGVTTDTYDILGLVTHLSSKIPFLSTQEREFLVQSYQKTLLQPYPPYSSIRINGHPLFYWARKGKINSVIIPQKRIRVYRLKLERPLYIHKKELLGRIYQKIATVEGDFRQSEIIETWKACEKKLPQQLILMDGKIKCSSGTYIRSLIHAMGQDLGCGATTLSLTRIAVGQFRIEESIRL